MHDTQQNIDLLSKRIFDTQNTVQKVNTFLRTEMK